MSMLNVSSRDFIDTILSYGIVIQEDLAGKPRQSRDLGSDLLFTQRPADLRNSYRKTNVTSGDYCKTKFSGT